MSLSIAETKKLASEYAETFSSNNKITVGFAPTPAGMSAAFDGLNQIENHSIVLGAQNLFWEEKGAYTGEVSPIHLKELKGTFSLVGHSEVRNVFHESDHLIASRLSGVIKAGLMPVFCFGEKWDERESGNSFSVIERQLRSLSNKIDNNDASKILLAYEPVWAISGGNSSHKAATPEDVKDAHEFTKNIFREIFNVDSLGILYGGSANPTNCIELSQVPNVDGFLVGGASLKVETFMPLYKALINAA